MNKMSSSLVKCFLAASLMMMFSYAANAAVICEANNPDGSCSEWYDTTTGQYTSDPGASGATPGCMCMSIDTTTGNCEQYAGPGC